MHLFLIACDVRSAKEGALREALALAARPFVGVADGPTWSRSSASGATLACSIRHPEEIAGTRSYVAEEGDVVVLFDGLPLSAEGSFPAHEAESLLRHWDRLDEELEGLFVAVRLDLRRDEVDLLTDTLGEGPLFHTAHGGGRLISNSVEAIRRLTQSSTPDPLGVSSFLSLGWAVGRSTLIEAIEAVPGGARTRVAAGRLEEQRHFSPATVARSLSRHDQAIEGLRVDPDIADRVGGPRRGRHQASPDRRSGLEVVACAHP